VAETFWGELFESVSAIIAIPVVLVAGTAVGIYEEFKDGGEGFDAGFDRVGDGLIELVEELGEFGDRHSGTLTRVAVSTTAIALIGAEVPGLELLDSTPDLDTAALASPDIIPMAVVSDLSVEPLFGQALPVDGSDMNGAVDDPQFSGYHGCGCGCPGFGYGAMPRSISGSCGGTG
jgi:hypothetical protein